MWPSPRARPGTAPLEIDKAPGICVLHAPRSAARINLVRAATKWKPQLRVKPALRCRSAASYASAQDAKSSRSLQPRRACLGSRHPNPEPEEPMRSEPLALREEIEQSMGLLRRH